MCFSFIHFKAKQNLPSSDNVLQPKIIRNIPVIEHVCTDWLIAMEKALYGSWGMSQ